MIRARKTAARVLALGWVGVVASWGLALGQPRWPQFRGPNSSGVAEGEDFPTEFGPGTNQVWSLELTPGNSSPAVWGDSIFLTTANETELQTVCIDRVSGAVRWRRGVPRPASSSNSGNVASPTPITDGKRVFSYFGPFGLVAYDFSGLEIWRKALPEPVTQHGVGSSPVLAGDLLLLVRDQDINSELLALSASDGAVQWRRDRPGFRRGFSTPLLWHAGGKALWVVAGSLRVVAYSLAGEEVWSVRGLPNEMCSSPVADDSLLYVAGWTPGSGVARMPTFDSLLDTADKDHDGRISREEATEGPARQHFAYIDANKDGFLTREEYESMAEIFGQSSNALLAIRPGGQGDVTETAVAWKQTKGLPYVPSPLLYRGHLYLVKNGGLASCFDARTGSPSYREERLGALGDYFSSPIAANGKICVASQPGVVVVYAAGDKLQVLARNALNETIMATPAIAGHQLYVRTQGHLYAFGTTSAARP